MRLLSVCKVILLCKFDVFALFFAKIDFQAVRYEKSPNSVLEKVKNFRVDQWGDIDEYSDFKVEGEGGLKGPSGS